MSKGIPLHISIHEHINTTPIKIIGNDLLQQIMGRINQKTHIGTMFKVSVGEGQYRITIIDHSIILTIVNQQYLRRGLFPVNKRKVNSEDDAEVIQNKLVVSSPWGPILHIKFYFVYQCQLLGSI